MTYDENPIEIVLSFLTIVVYTLTIWFTNIDSFFRSSGKIMAYYEIYVFSMVMVLSNLIL